MDTQKIEPLPQDYWKPLSLVRIDRSLRSIVVSCFMFWMNVNTVEPVYSNTSRQGNVLHSTGCQNTQVFILVNKNSLGP